MTARSISRSVASPFARSIVGRLAPWTPAALFAAGEEGVWLEASPTYRGQQVLWQQSDGTVIVDANGDPVGRDDDLSPNGNNATQPTSVDRPTYNTDGTLHWLGFGGDADNLRTADFGLPHLHSVSVAFYPTNDGDFILDGLVSNTGSVWISDQSGLEGQIRLSAGASLYSSNTVTLNEWNIVTAIFDGANSLVRLNGVEATGDTGTAAPGGVTLAWDGNMTSINRSLAGRIAPAVVRSGRFSSSQISEIESYLNDRVGGGVL